MPPDYTYAQLVADVTQTITDNAAIIVPVAILLACVNFVVGWFHYALEYLTKKPFKDR